jgi:hypothetical protein
VASRVHRSVLNTDREAVSPFHLLRLRELLL